MRSCSLKKKGGTCIPLGNTPLLTIITDSWYTYFVLIVTVVHTRKSTSCIHCQGLLWGSWQYLKKCCPPSQTTKGVKKRLSQPRHDPMLKAPILLGAVPPTEQGKMTQWREVWPQCVRPIKKCWPQCLPWRRK